MGLARKPPPKKHGRGRPKAANPAPDTLRLRASKASAKAAKQSLRNTKLREKRLRERAVKVAAEAAELQKQVAALDAATPAVTPPAHHVQRIRQQQAVAAPKPGEPAQRTIRDQAAKLRRVVKAGVAKLSSPAVRKAFGQLHADEDSAGLDSQEQRAGRLLRESMDSNTTAATGLGEHAAHLGQQLTANLSVARSRIGVLAKQALSAMAVPLVLAGAMSERGAAAALGLSRRVIADAIRAAKRLLQQQQQRMEEDEPSAGQAAASQLQLQLATRPVVFVGGTKITTEVVTEVLNHIEDNTTPSPCLKDMRLVDGQLVAGRWLKDSKLQLYLDFVQSHPVSKRWYRMGLTSRIEQSATSLFDNNSH